MSEATFTQQVAAMSSRLTQLYAGISSTQLSQPEMLPMVLKELGIASERLETAAKLLQQQNEKLDNAYQAVAAERQRYRELLELFPAVCLVTNAAGQIQQANHAAAKLFNLPQSLMVGKSMASFLTPENRPNFKEKLKELRQRTWVQDWPLCLQTRPDQVFDAIANVNVNHQPEDRSLTMCWLLHSITERKQVQTATPLVDRAFAQNCALQHFCKGETIPLEPEAVWQVYSGLVKLTTWSTTGEEVLVGLVGAIAPFGPSLTNLAIYQATALSDTQLRRISLAEIATSSELTQSLLSQVSKRLQQSEILLTIAGQRRVGDRLNSLLMLLEQEIGHPVSDGTRLSVRLTHGDLANACCTTRVTITRLLGRLQQKGKLKVDSSYHLILKKNWDC